MDIDKKIFIETISNYLNRFSKEDPINLEWLKRIVYVNSNTQISDKLLIAYLTEKGYKNIESIKNRSEKPKKEKAEKILPKLPKEISPFREESPKRNTRNNQSVDLDDEDFDPNEFLQSNKEKISNIFIPTKSFEDNTWLIETYQKANSNDILAEIVSKNMGLVEKIANRYVKASRHDLSYDDLVSIGKFGLIKAIERFDPTLGHQFSTYATWWVRQKITRAIMDEGTTIRIPVHMHEQINKLIKTENESIYVNDELDINWVCDQLNISKEKYRELKQIDKNFLGMASLYSIVSTEDDDSHLIDFIPYNPATIIGAEIEQFIDPYEQTLYKNQQEKIDEVLGTLSEKEQKIIRLRFGFENGSIITLEEIGKLFGVTRERIRQIEAKTIRKLRERLARKHLEYCDLTVEGM